VRVAQLPEPQVVIELRQLADAARLERGRPDVRIRKDVGGVRPTKESGQVPPGAVQLVGLQFVWALGARFALATLANAIEQLAERRLPSADGITIRLLGERHLACKAIAN
jgi:hypothetical protein